MKDSPAGLVPAVFSVRFEGCAHPAEGREVCWNGHDKPGETVEVAAAVAEEVALHFQQVEGVDHIAHGLAADEDIERDLLDGFTDGIRNSDDESPAVDAGDLLGSDSGSVLRGCVSAFTVAG